MLYLKNFSFSLDTTLILDQLNLYIPQGGYLSVLGPNGAGKSTLLKCLMGLQERGLQQGEARVKGKLLTQYTQRDLAKVMAYVPQAGGWIPPFSVEDFLRLSRYPHITGWGGLQAADRESIEKALLITGTHELRKRLLRSLSGGERQRVFLAAALAQEAECMVLDEPDSFLDPKHAFDLKILIKKLNQEQGITMITVTHDLNHPFVLGGYVLALQQGKQLFFGTGQELLSNHVLEQVYDHHFLYLRHPRTHEPIILAE